MAEIDNKMDQVMKKILNNEMKKQKEQIQPEMDALKSCIADFEKQFQ